MAYGDLTTLGDVKAWLQTGQSAFPPTDDALLTRLITAASQYIQTWLNRQIAQCDYMEVRDGTGGERLQFACFPVSAVLSLTIDGLAIPPAPPPAPSTGLIAGYVFSPTQLALRGYHFTRRAQNVVVTYTAGYPTIACRKLPRPASSLSRCAIASARGSARCRGRSAAARP